MEPATIVLAMLVNVGSLMNPPMNGSSGPPPPPSNALLAENGNPILNEDTNYLLTE